MADAKAQNRYRVIERLESGGMAEVFRGEAESLAGFKKQVAIKRVLPHLASNEKFIRMFLDEARLCARLNHANIVQVFDIGHVENTYFIVMEFVDGVNLKALIEHLKKRGGTVPVPISVFVCIEICNGLQYAHDITDAEGNLLGIVHRDVSPPNVLISKRGEIKIVDFGLAKAAMQVEKTEPGVVKGKFSYLAPETASGADADPQADVFAVGIMLWEMLAGRRLFLGDSDYATVKLVQQCVVPPLRKINPNVPEELERVVRKSLAKDKRARYQSAQELAEELAQFLFSHQMRVTGFDVARVVKEIQEEKRSARGKEGRSESVIDKLIADELGRFTSLESEAAQDDDGAGDEGAKPLLGDEFEDPTQWEFDDGGAGKAPLAGRGAEWHEAGRDDRLAGRARSRGLADSLDGDDLSPPQGPPLDDIDEQPTTVTSVAEIKRIRDSLIAKGSAGAGDSIPPPAPSTEAPARPSQPLVGSAAIQSSIPTRESTAPKKKGNGALIGIVSVVVLAGAAAALWFGHVIPH